METHVIIEFTLFGYLVSTILAAFIAGKLEKADGGQPQDLPSTFLITLGPIGVIVGSIILGIHHLELFFRKHKNPWYVVRTYARTGRKDV